MTLGGDEAHVLFALRTPGVSGQLAALTLDGSGNGSVAPLNGVFRFDGDDVTGPMSFSAEAPHVLSVADVEIEIEPVSVLPETEDALYRRLSDVADASVETDKGTEPAAEDSLSDTLPGGHRVGAGEPS